MITIINGTNRTGNVSQVITRYYHEKLNTSTNEVINYLSLEDVPMDMIGNGMFTDVGRSDQLTALQDNFIIPSEKIMFVVPEYNGGMPGILKLFIDACSTYSKDACFRGKKIGMVGVAAGRAGNLRGMDHLTGVMNYLGAIVLPNQLPISSITSLVANMELIDQPTKEVLDQHVNEFLDF